MVAYRKGMKGEKKMVEQMTMFPAPEKAPDKAPANARVFHVKLSSNFQTVEFDVDVMRPDAKNIIDSGVYLVNELGRSVENSDQKNKAKENRAEARPDPVIDRPSEKQINLLIRHLGGTSQTYEGWSKQQAWEKIQQLKQVGVLNK